MWIPFHIGVLLKLNFPELIRQSPVRPPACMYSRVLSSLERQQGRLRGPSYNVQRVWGSCKYNISRCIVESLCSWMQKHRMPRICDAFAVNGIQNFQKEWKDGLHENWGLDTLWVHPPRHLWPRVAEKIVFQGNRGIAPLSATKEASWWWLLVEVVVDWLDVPARFLLYEYLNGKLLPSWICFT